MNKDVRKQFESLIEDMYKFLYEKGFDAKSNDFIIGGFLKNYASVKMKNKDNIEITIIITKE